MNILALAMRMALREWRAGELRVLLLAVAIAVAGLASVNAVTLRLHLALDQESNRLLGADLVLVSDHALRPALLADARRRGLAVAQTAQFPSMASTAAGSRLAQIKAVGAGYPLRGSLRIATRAGLADHTVSGIPPRGTVWLEARLANALHAPTGSTLELGYSKLIVAGILTSDPDLGGNLFNLAPWLLMNRADVPATGLITTGSRVSYRLLIAGNSTAVAAFHEAWAPHLARGEKLLTAADARPQLREILGKAERYLGLSVLLAVMLAAAAILLSARHFVSRRLDACALLRCFGAGQGTIVALYGLQILSLGLLAAVLGMALGYAGQAVLARMLGGVANLDLPPATALPFMQAGIAGLELLAGFSFPTLLALRRVSALRILRRDGGTFDFLSGLAYLVGFVVLTGLLLWQVGEVHLVVLVLAGLVLTLLLTAASAWLLVLAAGWLGTHSLGSWRHGMLNLRRRSVGSIIQVSAFTLAMTALLLLTVVRGDLLGYWHDTLPPRAPNRFVINIQPDQVAAVRNFFRQRGFAAVQFYPMIRGRLVAINGREVNSANYSSEQTQRLVDREFNLSYADRLDPDSVLVAGKRWEAAGAAPQFSVEQGIADSLHLKLGDSLQFDVAGTPVSAPVTSLRKVKWDSFRVNFFVVGNTALLKNLPASYITSFYLPSSEIGMLGDMVKTYPNLTVIDVSAILQSLQDMLERVAAAVQFVFIFSIASALAVLYAALVSTRDERMRETALWRVLGASRWQLWLAQATEFGATGLLAGVLAATGASVIAWRLSTRVFNLPYHFDARLWLIAIGSGCIGVMLVGMAGLWRVSRSSPWVTLREARD